MSLPTTSTMRIEKNERVPQSRFLLTLEDGTTLQITEQELLSFDLSEGRELEEEMLAALRASAALSQAKAQAAALIGRRALSRQDLIRKLTEKGTAPEDAQAAADWLAEIGALDDAAYAALVVRSCAAAGYGPARYRDKLYRAGIPKELWQDAMAQAPDPDELIGRYLAGRLGGSAADQGELRRAADALYRRGFAWDGIRRALREYAEKDEWKEDNGL